MHEVLALGAHASRYNTLRAFANLHLTYVNYTANKHRGGGGGGKGLKAEKLIELNLGECKGEAVSKKCTPPYTFSSMGYMNGDRNPARMYLSFLCPRSKQGT